MRTPDCAMVLAAGYGKRMRNLTSDRPKPLVEFMGRPLIDHVMDRLADAGVSRTVVNVHHFADLLQAHLKERAKPAIVFSDERGELLETGGGIKKALPLLGDAPFYLVNSDSLWIEGANPNLSLLAAKFDPARMDALLMLAPVARSLGYDGRGDYHLQEGGSITRRKSAETAPYAYAGAAILKPEFFHDAPKGAFPLGRLFDRAESNAHLYGIEMQGTFLHVGTPEAVVAAEDAVRRAKG